MRPTPYRDPDVLYRHARAVLGTYYPECIDHRYGGYVLQFDEADRHVYDGRAKHLVGTARAVHNFSAGVLLDGPDWCRSAAAHGLEFLADGHWDDENEGYDWLLAGRETTDADRYAYGHAFVVLAAARAHEAGLPGAREELERAVGVMEERFRDGDGDDPRYADQAAPDWSSVAAYRGQNANMHACEALLAAYESTGEERYLERSLDVARAVTGLAEDGRLWEHYTADWEPDYSREQTALGDRFGPWGYQPGHHAEWAKLCCLLADHDDAAWLRERARRLFDTAVGWWLEDGGFPYTVDRDGNPTDATVYGWPVAEAIGASAVLADRGGDGSGRDREEYLEWYDRLWRYAEANLINRKYGTWYQRRTADGERDPEGGPTVEPGYHPVSNALVARRVLDGGE